MGDVPDGFERFFSVEYERMVRALTLVFGDRVCAEDAAQVGFERALARWARVSVMERPGTWVYVVALRHGRSVLRSERVFDGGDPVEMDHAQSAVDRLALRQAVAALPAQQRAVVVLRHLVGLRLGEIADALGIRVGTVKSTLHAAHRNLRVDLQDEPREGVSRHAN